MKMEGLFKEPQNRTQKSPAYRIVKGSDGEVSVVDLMGVSHAEAVRWVHRKQN